MIKLFSLKQQKKEGDQTARGGQQKKASAAQLRIQKGIFLPAPITTTIYAIVCVRVCAL